MKILWKILPPLLLGVTVFAHAESDASLSAPFPIPAKRKAREYRADTTGLYPLWENTGHVESAGDVRISTTGVQMGMPGVHIGALPLPFFYRTPNAYLKGSLFSSNRAALALQVGFFHLLPSASRSAFSPMYPTRLDNSDFSLTVIPMHLAFSWTLSQWLEWHHTLGAVVNLPSGNITGDFTPGYLSGLELNPLGNHALVLHLGKVGFERHEFFLAGASYRFRNSWLEARFGYFYRFRAEGAQAGPLASLGFLL